jgi:hypothetical protein
MKMPRPGSERGRVFGQGQARPTDSLDAQALKITRKYTLWNRVNIFRFARFRVRMARVQSTAAN